ncbi:uncharacterized protein ACA1_093090 [Acanthamoeba castellanii str. Neff]|uniref:Uncharacterized protein n=1 Tax=Acanthamoeba castellanii (strain ATCC 30010 / Neff) TaxID=1257118 RepID=L8GIU3_ACACF|nr:uncharacterized protein ACA1_093090 [Acanthamoeba castellanii str. Neff]ELR12774.1 hypothetical protein ACA1_093090 [Acanthamoeba castellanii str. Neff]
MDPEYLVLLRDHLTGPLHGSQLRHVYAIDHDQNSHVLLFHLSTTALRKMRAHPYVALVEAKQGATDLPKVCNSPTDNNLSTRLQCSGKEIAVSARFIDIAVEQPNAGGRRTVTLLEYKGGFYIALPTDNPSVSTYKCPTRLQGTMSDIVTTWFAIRFNPQDLTVNTGDYTFVTSTGYNTHHKDMGPDAATHVPFATCFGCEASQRDDGRAVVDLHGTPFVVLDNQFKFAGYFAYGTWTYSNNAQLVDLTGGGYCGWTAPLAAADNENMACNGGWHLQLGLLL